MFWAATPHDLFAALDMRAEVFGDQGEGADKPPPATPEQFEMLKRKFPDVPNG